MSQRPFDQTNLADETTRLRAIVSEQADVIARQRAEIERARSTFEAASTLARVGLWECSLPDGRLRWSDAVYDIFGLPRGSAVDRAASLRLYQPGSLEAVIEQRARAIAERSSFRLDAQIVTPAGDARWVRISGKVECDGDRPVRVFGMKQDVTAEKEQARRTLYVAEHDALTGLLNRAAYKAHMAALEDGGGLAGILLVDLDGFKQINDTLGHIAGDDLIRLAAMRISRAVGSSGLVARLGGDEFAALIAPPASQSAIEAIAASIVAALAEPFELSARRCRVGGSVGVAHADGCPPSELFSRADAALYAAKAAGRGVYRIFEASAQAA